MALKPYRKLPVHVRKSRENLYEYLRKELNGSDDDSEPETPTHEVEPASPNESETPTGRNISFVINDGTNPIQGATVTIDEVSKTTGSAGGCSFPGINDGDVTVTVAAEGYTTKTETVTVSENDTAFEISLVAA